MRYKDLVEHQKAMPVKWNKLKIDDSYQFECNFENYAIYKNDNGGYETWIASNHDKETLGYVVLEKRSGGYFTVKNMMAYSRGAVSVLIDLLISKNYKIISDNEMTSDGEKFFLKYSNSGRLYSIDVTTGKQIKWDDSLSNSDMDPRLDTNKISNTGDKHKIYWLIENYDYTPSKFGRPLGIGSKTLQRVIEHQLNESKLEIEDY